MSQDIHEMNKRATLVGHICTQYSFLDYLISNILWSFLNLDKEAGMIVTGNMDIRPKIDMAISLSIHFKKIDDVRSTLQKIKNNSSKDNGFISKRNQIIHGIHSSRDNDPTVMVEAHRKKGHRQRQPMTVEYIEETHLEIASVNKELAALLEKNKINVH